MYIIRYLWSIGINKPEKPNEEVTEEEVKIDSEKELVTLTKQLEKEDMEKVVSFIRNQIQKDRNA